MPSLVSVLSSNIGPAALSLSEVGDFNGDGIDDFVVGVAATDANTGSAYVIYGSDTPLPATLDITTLSPSQGFEIIGDYAGDLAGFSVAEAGDINGDGFSDIVLSAPGATPEYTYIYTRHDGYTRFYSTYIPITYTYTYTGYTSYGGTYTEQRTYQSGYTDFWSYYYGTSIPYTYTTPRDHAGMAYVIFGTDSAPDSIEVADLGGDGMQILGVYSHYGDDMGVAGVDDFNGDGVDDVVVGVPELNKIYVVFGDDTGLPDEIDLQVDSGDWMTITTEQDDSGFGLTMAAGDDINGDGFGDIAIAAPDADSSYFYSYTRTDGYTRFYSTYIPYTYTNTYTGYTTYGGRYTEQRTYQGGYTDFWSYYYGGTRTYTGTTPVPDAGQVYVVFGDDTLSGGPIRVEDLDGSNGFVFSGLRAGDHVGADVATIGDVNGDGFVDLLIGATGASSYYSAYGDSGEAYVVFGGAAPFAAEMTANDLNSAAGFIIGGDGGGTLLGRTVAGVGDVNGDGVDDMVVVDSAGGTGRAHLIFGVQGDWFEDGFALWEIDGVTGYTFVSYETDADTEFATSVTGADVNDDGTSDIIIGSATGETLVITAGMAELRALDRMDGGRDGFIDTVYLSAPYVIGTNGVDVLDGDGFGAIMYGLNGADSMSGGTGTDRIIGGKGADVMWGGKGFDTLQGDSGADTLMGGSGKDLLLGGKGTDVLRGQNGVDELRGGDGRDALFGGIGQDTLIDGRGTDRVTGGKGADTFVFVSDGSFDVLLDYQVGLDQIDISDWGATAETVTVTYQVDGSADVSFGAELLSVRGFGGTILDVSNFDVDDLLI